MCCCYDIPIDQLTGFFVEAVTISPKFQVVIPKRVREQLGLRAGQKLEVVQIGSRIELVPEQPACALRGLLRGIDTTVQREPDRA